MRSAGGHLFWNPETGAWDLEDESGDKSGLRTPPGYAVCLYDKTRADYIITARKKDFWIRIIQKNSREILFSNTTGDLRSDLYDILVNMGIPAKKPNGYTR
ncbi:MAG TPA: hypothetical protein VJC03_06825 [bacterium]|nr:hypothetical protein [bacterium]